MTGTDFGCTPKAYGIFRIIRLTLYAALIVMVGFIVGKTKLRGVADSVLPPPTAKSSGPTFDDLLDAIEWIESKGDANSVGDNGNAVGAYQLHKIYVDDVNRSLALRGIKNAFTYKNRWNRNKSRDMVMVYTEHYATKAWNKIWNNGQFATTKKREGFMKYFELQTRIHNGGPRGYRLPATKKYWLKVKERLAVYMTPTGVPE